MTPEAAAAQEAVAALAKALNIAPGAIAPKAACKKRAAAQEEAIEAAVYEVTGEPVIGDVINTAGMVKLLDAMSEIIIKNEVHFCEMDSVAGDGDFGMSIAKGFRQLKADWATRKKGNIGEFLRSPPKSSKSTAAALPTIWVMFMAAGSRRRSQRKGRRACRYVPAAVCHTGHWHSPDAARS